MKTGKRLFIAAGVCLILALIARFCFVGFRFSALLLCAGALCFAFFGWTVRRGTRAARFLAAAAGVILAAGFVCFLAAEIPVLRDGRSTPDDDADYLIVMGAAVHGVTPSRSMTERADAALAWLSAHPDGKAIVSGGQGGGEDITEARAMFDYMTGAGADPDRILLESRATSTYENILFSLHVLADDGGDPAGRVALCSSEYHLHRCVTVARALGCDPVPVAARTGNLALAVNYAVREAFAMWKYRLFGLG